MRIRFWQPTGKEFTYQVLSEAGVEKVIATSLPEIGSTGYYTVVDSNVIAGDSIPVSENGKIIGGGVADERLALESTIDVVTSNSIFTLVSGPNSSPEDDDIFKDLVISVTSVSKRKLTGREVRGYVAAGRKITVDSEFPFDLVSGDIVRIWVNMYSTSEPVNIDHSSESIVYTSSDKEVAEGTVDRESSPELETTNVDRDTSADLDTGTVDDEIIQPTVEIDRSSSPSIQGD